MRSLHLAIVVLCLGILLTSVSSALTFRTVDIPELAPAGEGRMRLVLENELEDDVQDVSVSLAFENLPFTPIGSSEDSVDEIEEDDEEEFTFRLRAANNAAPGNYEIPYTIRYYLNGTPKERRGTFGIRVVGEPQLSFTISSETPVIGNKGKVTLQIINTGFSEARFVTVRAEPEGMTVLSDSTLYIGSIDSDDFETANFDVTFNDKDAVFAAAVEYRNFDNELVTENVYLPVEVYTQEEAQNLGIVQRSNLVLYIALAVILVGLIVVWRIVRRRRLNRNMERDSGG